MSKLLAASNNNENKSCLPKQSAVGDKILIVLTAEKWMHPHKEHS
jgi:hypothetical protein